MGARVGAIHKLPLQKIETFSARLFFLLNLKTLWRAFQDFSSNGKPSDA
jgi:putative Ca2+/H+ antiporter (TMEM165/GDT1 family)